MTRTDRAVVVGLDGSEASLRALRWAAGYADAAHRPLHLVHAVQVVTAAYADSSSGSRTLLGPAGLRMVEEGRAVVEHDFPDVKVDAGLPPGGAGDTLLRLSERAELVVLGSRGLGPVRSALLGSVGVALLRRSRCPVVVVRPEQAGVPRHGVVAGLEVAETSAPVLDLAFRLASLLRQPLTLVHATGVPYVGTTGTYRTLEGPDPESERLSIAETSAGFAARYPEVAVSARTVRGRPEEALIEASADADLLVLGAHRQSLPRQVVSGSVSVAVVEHARCTVAVVPLVRRPDREQP